MAPDATHPDAGSGTVRRFLSAKLRLVSVKLRVMAVVIGLALGSWIALPGLITTIRGVEGAPIGACVIVPEPGNVDSPEKVADCAEPAATLVVLAHRGAEGECFKIGGNVRETGTPDRRTCLGRIGADPARSTNTAVEGECLTADATERTACAAVDARYRIVKRIDDVPAASANTACPDDNWTSVINLEIGTSINGFGAGRTMRATSTVLCTETIEPAPR
jgi:hypothetical protein